MKSGSAYLDFADAVDELSAISSLGENANALQSELAKDPELCKDAGPYGLATALAVLNGLARRSEQFLPNGCTP